MLKVFGKGDANPNNLFSKFGIGNMILGQDIGAAKELVPHTITLYEQTVELMGIIESLVPAGGSGVVPGSFGKEFQMNSQCVVNINGRLYARMAPGICVNGGVMYVSKPSTGPAAKKLGDLLGFNPKGGREMIEFQYNFENDTFKAKVKKMPAGASKYDSPDEFYFPNQLIWEDSDKPGFPSGVKVLEAMFRNRTLGPTMRRAIGNDLTQIPLELMIPVSRGTNYIIMNESGEIVATKSEPDPEGPDVQIAKFNANYGGASGIDMTHEKLFGGGGMIISDGSEDYVAPPGTKLIFKNASSITENAEAGEITIVLPTSSP